MHSRVLKELADELGEPLYVLSLKNPRVPGELKKANIVPVFKNSGVKNEYPGALWPTTS